MSFKIRKSRLKRQRRTVQAMRDESHWNMHSTKLCNWYQWIPFRNFNLTFSLIIVLQKGDCRVYRESMFGIGGREVYVEIWRHTVRGFQHGVTLWFYVILAHYSQPMATKKINSTQSLHYRLRCLNSQIVMRGNSSLQRFAKQTSSAAVTSDWFVVWYPGLCNKCHLIHGSFSGNPGDPHKAHTRSTPKGALRKNKIHVNVQAKVSKRNILYHQ